MQADQRETTRKGLDLSDVDALLQHLKESVVQDGFTEQFVDVMHSLMTIPGEQTTGDQMWNNVRYIVHHATNVVQDDDGNEHPRLSYAELKELLETKEKMDIEEHQSKVDELNQLIEENRAQLHSMKVRLCSFAPALTHPPDGSRGANRRVERRVQDV